MTFRIEIWYIDKLIFWIEISYIDVSRQYAGWVWIWVRSNNFRESYAPLTYKNSINFQFPLIISITNWYFELKFSILTCHGNMQVEFEFGSSWIIFGSVMTLGLIKNSNNFQFPLIISIKNWHFKLKFDTLMCHDNMQVEFELGPVD